MSFHARVFAFLHGALRALALSLGYRFELL